MPFREVLEPLLKMFANDAASDGFSATIKTVFILKILKIETYLYLT
jgi:hypothetical protein